MATCQIRLRVVRVYTIRVRPHMPSMSRTQFSTLFLTLPHTLPRGTRQLWRVAARTPKRYDRASQGIALM